MGYRLIMVNKDNPVISVIMGIYNEKRKDYVIQAINSILEQSYENFEYIICDDGSEEKFYMWLQKICKKDPRIRLIHNKNNRGLAYTLNRCIEMARGTYLARMDADDISKKDRLKKQLFFLESHQEYAMVGCNAEFIDDKGVWGIYQMIERPQKRDFLKTSVFIHPAILIRTDVMKKMGGYSTEIRALRTEDYELFMRIYAAGFQGYNMQEKLFQYREDINAFSKRKYRYRINEAVIRYHGFCSLGILKGNFRYVIKPLIIGLIPGMLMERHRKKFFSKKRI